MARRCFCALIVHMLDNDPRLVALQPLARFLWQELARKAEGYGGCIPVTETQELSLMVRFEKPDVETHLETLLERGLIDREDGVLVFPFLRDAAGARAARSERARSETGRDRGGRPLKGETAEQARLRRAQAALILPISGGRPETPKTQQETSRASDSDSDSDNQISSDAREPLREFAARCAEVVGLDPAKGAWTWQDVATWRRQGLTDAEILDVLETVTRRAQAKGIKVGGFRYFQRAMDEALANRPAPAAPVSPETAAYLAQMAEWRIHRLGPPPIMQGRAVA